jgi:putative colanic acid biosynthesis acetyltransferase WcaF
VVSQKAYLCTASHDVDDPAFPLVGAPITIGSGAWVAAAAFVGPGVTVGEGAVLGACAVVSRDVEPRAIMVGNPAQFVRWRQSGEAPA